MSKRCLNCGLDNRDTAAFCANCRAPLSGGSLPAAAPPIRPPATGPAYAGPPAPQAYLAGSGQRYPLADQVQIGRSPTCQINLSDSSVSSQHAEILWDGRSFILRDLGSTNGTRVNRRSISGDTRLSPGDQIHFGQAAFVLELAQTDASGLAVGGTQVIDPQRLQQQISRGAGLPSSGVGKLRSGEPHVRGPIRSEPQERQDQPPPDPARALVLLAVVVFFLGLLFTFIATLLTIGIILLICGGATLLFIVPFLWMPIQLLFDNVIRSIRDEKPVTAVSFQVLDESSNQIFDVGFIRKPGRGGGGLHLGDKVEVWGRLDGNYLQARRIRVYESHGQVTDYNAAIRKGWPIWIGLLALALVVGIIGFLAISVGLVQWPP